MDDRLPRPQDPGSGPLHRGNLLGPAIRRDLADLNRLFLELGSEPALDEDPRFAVADAVRRGLVACGPDDRARLAEAPFSLFLVRLPPLPPAADRVADARPPPAPDAGAAARCHAFVLLALSVTRQLAGAEPLAPRIALGVSPEDEGRLAALGPAELARLAAWPGVVRPRWPRHERFWAMLIGAARRADPALLRWAHCAGLCLLTTGDEAVAVALAPSRRRARVARGSPGAGLSC